MSRYQFYKTYRTDTQNQQSRLHLLIVVLIVLSLILLLRLGYLQISEFKHYQTLSIKNQMTVIPIAPPRGVILDRNGVLLAENTPMFVLEIIPEHVKHLDKTLKDLRQILPSITDEELENFKKIKAQNRAFIPIPLKLKLSEEDVARFALDQYRFPGVSVKARLMRHYPYGEVAAHALGYVGRINIDELKKVSPSNYRATNFMGKSGIEKYYESSLHGQVGYQIVETDVSGRTLRVFNKQNPQSGTKLYLSIDIRLQQAAYEALKDKRGAVVLMNVHNGEILLMASSPSFDPNLFVTGVSQKDYKTLSNALQRPLYNRAVRGLYPPASTIKPFIGLAGLDKGFITPNTTIFDRGIFKLPTSKHIFNDHKKYGHGMVNLNRAITVSCDTYFYQLGTRMGIAHIAEMLRHFGFGKLTEVDLNEEASGIVPSPFWKRQSKGVSWYPGDTVITSIGQGFTLATPLQIASATATLSQRGLRFKPHLLMKSASSDDNGEISYQVSTEDPVTVSDETYWDTVKEAMHQVIVSNEGTGYRFGRNPPYSVAAKTGTAQVHAGNKYDKTRNEDIPEALRNNSLFIAFTPIEKPDVALAVVLENDPTAPTVARQILDAYYQFYPMNESDETK